LTKDDFYSSLSDMIDYILADIRGKGKGKGKGKALDDCNTIQCLVDAVPYTFDNVYESQFVYALLLPSSSDSDAKGKGKGDEGKGKGCVVH